MDWISFNTFPVSVSVRDDTVEWLFATTVISEGDFAWPAKTAFFADVFFSRGDVNWFFPHREVLLII